MQEFGRRLRSIDALRGFAVVLMFLQHFPLWLMYQPEKSEFYMSMFAISRFAAPMFLLVVGISMVLSAKRRISNDGRNSAVKHLVWRGFFIILAGFALNVVTFHSISDLNILYTIGLSIIFLSALSTDPRPVKCLVYALVLYIISETVIKLDAIKNFLDMFQYPVLPWTIFVIFGIAIGNYILVFQRDDRTKKLPYYLEFSAILLGILSIVFVMLGFPFRYWPYSTAPFITATTSLMLYFVAIFFWIYEVDGKNPVFLRPLIVYGRYALLLYFVHRILIVTIPELINMKNSFSETESIIALLAFLLISWLLLRKR